MKKKKFQVDLMKESKFVFERNNLSWLIQFCILSSNVYVNSDCVCLEAIVLVRSCAEFGWYWCPEALC